METKNIFKNNIFASIFGLSINLLLAMTKLFIGLRTNCLCIMVDSINNFGDMFMGILAVLGFLLLKAKPSEKFPHGYGRMEYITGFIMSLIITIIGLSFVYSSLERLFYTRIVWFTWIYLYILIGTLLIKLALGFYYRWLEKYQKSTIFHIMSKDSFIDSAITFIVILSFVCIHYIKFKFDAIMGIVISTAIVFNGIKLILESCSSLLGKSIDKNIKEKIYDAISKNNEIVIEKIDFHTYGTSPLSEYYYIFVKFNENKIINERILIIEKIKNELKQNNNINTEFIIEGDNKK